ncbi:hypothetical protein WIX39_022635 [Variovorax sp. AB1(2024)]|uniref:hypothetical protein n=1 Tax=Variovorax sp. AB1(2024) TaxID=3132214 RepID=UPI00309E1EE8
MLDLGKVVATKGAIGAFDDSGENPVTYITRHAKGDWGVVDQEDSEANDAAVKGGMRVLSAYVLPRTNVKVWIITEWDRSVTTVLLPDEY